LCPQEINYRFFTVICLTLLGDYTTAQREYRSIVQTSYSWDQMARSWWAYHMIDALKEDQTLRIPDEIADKAPFATLRRAIDCHDTLRRYAARIPTKKQGFIVYAWSPDSRRLLCGWGGIYGAMRRMIRDTAPGLFAGPFLKIIDIESGEGQCVTRNFGGFAAWSPDGKHIAFPDKAGNLCLVSPEGGQPRIVAQGNSPQWSRDSHRLYFRPRRESRQLYSIDIPNPDLEPVEVARSPGWFVPCEERGWMAFGAPTGVSLVDCVSGSILYHCSLPWPPSGWQLHCSPNGRELFFASWGSPIRAGPFVLDTEAKELYRVLDYPVDQMLWSPDGSKVAVAANCEVWIVDVDPNVPISRSLGHKVPGNDLLGYELAKLTLAVATDSLYPENYLERAMVYMSLGRYPEADSDLRQFEAVVTTDDHHIGYELFLCLKNCYANALHDAAALLVPYTERFMQRFPKEVPSYRALIVEMAQQHEQEGRTELANRWKARLESPQSLGD